MDFYQYNFQRSMLHLMQSYQHRESQNFQFLSPPTNPNVFLSPPTNPNMFYRPQMNIYIHYEHEILIGSIIADCLHFKKYSCANIMLAYNCTQSFFLEI